MINVESVAGLRTLSIVFSPVPECFACKIISPLFCRASSIHLLLCLFPRFSSPSRILIPPCSPLSNFLIVTILYWIWTSRNLSTFHNSTQNSRQIIDLIKNDVKSRIRCATADSIRNFGSFRLVFCSVDSDNNITFLLETSYCEMYMK